MYVPILKNRTIEMRFLKNYSDLMNNNIIPMIEVIDDIYETKYKTDPQTGNYIYELKKGKERRNRIKLPTTENDIITINDIVSRMNQKAFFVDYFRFYPDEYSDEFDYSKVELSLRMSKSFDFYKQRVIELCSYEQVIPVISIKENFKIEEEELCDFINNLKDKGKRIAIRINVNLFEEYSKTLVELLTTQDYVFLDIREEEFDAYFMELEDFGNLETKANKIILNSPRKRSIRNNQYEESGVTSLINNAVATEYLKYGLSGYGDYCGLKDALPSPSAGSNGTGAAICLLYDYEINGFHVFMNSDTSLGTKGYIDIIKRVKHKQKKLDPDESCRAYKFIDKLPGTGSWSSWHEVTLIRYLHQVSRHLIID